MDGLADLLGVRFAYGQSRLGFRLMPKAPAGQCCFAQGHMFSIPANAAHPEAA